jgi:hypothetical protein
MINTPSSLSILRTKDLTCRYKSFDVCVGCANIRVILSWLISSSGTVDKPVAVTALKEL